MSSKILLTGNDLAQVTTAHDEVLECVLVLGATRLDFHERERQIEQKALACRTRRDEIVKTIVKRLDSEAGIGEGNWSFDPLTMSLTRE